MLERHRRAHLVGNRAYAADAGDDVDDLVGRPTDDQLLEVAWRFEDREARFEHRAVRDAQPKCAFTLDSRDADDLEVVLAGRRLCLWHSSYHLAMRTYPDPGIPRLPHSRQTGIGPFVVAGCAPSSLCAPHSNGISAPPRWPPVLSGRRRRREALDRLRNHRDGTFGHNLAAGIGDPDGVRSHDLTGCTLAGAKHGPRTRVQPGAVGLLDELRAHRNRGDDLPVDLH